MHIPVALWAATSFLVAREVFASSPATAASTAVAAAALIYCLERVILATPKSQILGLVRTLIGLLTAILGASAVDLILFDKEIVSHLHGTRTALLTREHEGHRSSLQAEVENVRHRWQAAHETAQCEGNGTCGSRRRSAGPLYAGLLKHAEQQRLDYQSAVARAASVAEDFALKQSRLTPEVVRAEAGLLVRLQALHDYLRENRLASTLWAVFFLFVLALELSVVAAKFAFGETADDVIERCREAAARYQATAYLDALTSPVAAAQARLNSSYR